MNKLIIVNATAKLNGGKDTPQDISKFEEGGIGFYELADPTKWLAAKPTKDFAIVAGEGDNNQATVLPEINLATLQTQYAKYADAVNGTFEITVPTPVKGKTYSLSIIKADAVPTERYEYNFNEDAFAETAAEAQRIAKSIGKQIETFLANRRINGTVEVTGAKIKVTITETHDMFKVIAADELYSEEATVTEQQTAIGDKEYVLDLAKKYAANDGYDFTDPSYTYMYKGYLQNVTGDKYDIFTLRFRNTRGAANTSMPELPWQVVTIAVDEKSPALASIKTILGVEDTTASSSTGE